MSRSVNPGKVARNFIDEYGREKLNWLLVEFEKGTSGQVLADILGVSRERIRQWKNTFGTSVTVYQVSYEVKGVLAPRARR